LSMLAAWAGWLGSGRKAAVAVVPH